MGMSPFSDWRAVPDAAAATIGQLVGAREVGILQDGMHPSEVRTGSAAVARSEELHQPGRRELARRARPRHMPTALRSMTAATRAQDLQGIAGRRGVGRCTQGSLNSLRRLAHGRRAYQRRDCLEGTRVANRTVHRADAEGLADPG
jgi:hypothetical protein